MCSDCATKPKGCCSTGSSVVFWRAGCAGMVLRDACLHAGNAHTCGFAVFKDASASGEMKTVQGMNVSFLTNL